MNIKVLFSNVMGLGISIRCDVLKRSYIVQSNVLM